MTSAAVIACYCENGRIRCIPASKSSRPCLFFMCLTKLHLLDSFLLSSSIFIQPFFPKGFKEPPVHSHNPKQEWIPPLAKHRLHLKVSIILYTTSKTNCFRIRQMVHFLSSTGLVFLFLCKDKELEIKILYHFNYLGIFKKYPFPT